MLEFDYAPPPNPIKERITLDGESVGTIWKNSYGYQCQLKFGPLKDDYRCLTLNGTGKTKEEAIRHAMRQGLDDADRLQRAVAILERAMRDSVSQQ